MNFQITPLGVGMSAAFDLAEQGAALAAEHADRVHEDWTKHALEAFTVYASTHTEFSTEDVIAGAVSVPPAPDKRAWGQVVLAARRLKIISGAGVGHSKLAHAHGRYVNLWRSLICASSLIGA